MKIRILASNEIRHIDNSTGSALVSAGLAEALPGSEAPGLPKPYKAGTVPAPQWSVEHIQLGTRGILAVVMEINGQRTLYTGDPKRANDRVTWDGGGRYLNGCGREIPREILKQYAKQWTEPEPMALSGEHAALLSSGSNETMAAELAARNRGRS